MKPNELLSESTMTNRDYIAIEAMKGLITKETDFNEISFPEYASERAYEYADALIKESNNKSSQ